METDTAQPVRIRSRIACKPCRQAKVRCGMRNPPCTRCLRLKISCTLDATFRRVSKTERVQQLENHVQELQGLVVMKSGGAAALSPESSSSTAIVCSEAGPTDCAVRDTSLDNESGQTPPRQRASKAIYSIGEVVLRPEQASTLVALYFEKYHQLLPFLDPLKNAEDYYNSSRLLFWSLIAVSARQFRGDTFLLTKLTPALNKLLWKTIISNPTSLTQTQALILQAYWPLPNFRLWTDKSLVYANLALSYATLLGLHRPGHEQDYMKQEVHSTHTVIIERTKTWLACIITCHGLAIDVGQPPIVLSLEGATSQRCRELMETQIPLELCHNLLIQQCSYRSAHALSRHSEYDFQNMEGLEESFDLLQQSLGVGLSFMNELRLTGARMYFLCNYFLRDTPDEQRKAGILRAYSTAISLITTIMSHDTAYEDMQYAPTTMARMIFVAGLVIFRVLHSSYRSTSHDKLDWNTAHMMYRTASFILHQLSVHREGKDFPTRAADVLSELWRGGQSDLELQNKAPTLQVKSRMGSSLVFDCLLIRRDYRRLLDNQPTLNVSGSQSDHSVNELRSPRIQEAIPGVTKGHFEYSISDTGDGGDHASVWSFLQDPSHYTEEDWGLYDMV